MTRDVLPGSKNQDYLEQQRLVSAYAQKSKIDYQIPNILDAATAIFMEYSVNGNRLYSDNPRPFGTFTRCQWRISGPSWDVGGFNQMGLSLLSNSSPKINIGVACVRKL